MPDHAFPKYAFLGANQFTLRRSASGPRSRSAYPWLVNERHRSPKPVHDKSLMSGFSAALREGDFLDNRAIELAGAAVWLPYGMELRRLFDNFVSERYDHHGLKEFHYPTLVPHHTFTPLKQLYDLDNKILLVGTQQEIDAGRPRGALSPTGEATIYRHWADYIGLTGLPLRMYRNATYFRPISHQAGMGIFNSMEAGGVFEFHAAYASRSWIEAEINAYHAMLEDILEHYRVERIWSLRPPWTNNAAVSVHTFGVDTLLPGGTSLQVAAIYDQDTVFSKIFGICVPPHKNEEYTRQVAGYCSRRLLMSRLYGAYGAFGKLFLHSNMSPLQVGVIFHIRDSAQSELTALAKELRGEHNLRISIRVCRDPAEVNSERKMLNAKGVPLVAIVQDRRFASDPFNVVVIRGDNLQEFRVALGDLGKSCAELIVGALKEVDHQSDMAIADLFSSGFGEPVERLDQIRDAGRIVSLIPLTFEESAVRAVENKGAGEILGFVRDEVERGCVHTGKRTPGLAVFCRRF
jgi:hypothetical protein